MSLVRRHNIRFGDIFQSLKVFGKRRTHTTVATHSYTKPLLSKILLETVM